MQEENTALTYRSRLNIEINAANTKAVEMQEKNMHQNRTGCKALC